MIKATHMGELKPNGLLLPCYVLEDGRRVLSGRGMQEALNLGQTRGQKIPRLANNNSLSSLIGDDLRLGIFSPIHFIAPAGFKAYGYEATLLVDLCEVLLQARELGIIPHKYEAVADRAEILIRAFAKVGIIALVDEATGYQDVRMKDALEKILNMYLLERAKKYEVTFPLAFYKEIFRLNDWEWRPESAQKKPVIISRWTNDLIYERLAPGLLKELQRRNPKNEKGYRKHKHFQFLTDEVGEPKLREFFGGILALARVATSWRKFTDMMERAYPKPGETLRILYPEDED